MTLRERLQAELAAAVKGGDVRRRDTLRMAWNAVYNAEKAARRPLTEDEVVAALARELKTRRETVEAVRAGGREDLAREEEARIAILAEFLPQPLSEAELDALVEAAIAETGARTRRDLGRVMAVLAPRTRGRADGRLVSERVARALAAREAAEATAEAHSTPSEETVGGR
ncbi:MAG TPA: GatB/YqeY domain-containing protein [Candidatus Binatia bacterium]|nr:GatB/YqeY domain-containing protein [Candidatus Binatia bacterium]